MNGGFGNEHLADFVAGGPNGRCRQRPEASACGGPEAVVDSKRFRPVSIPIRSRRRRKR